MEEPGYLVVVPYRHWARVLEDTKDLCFRGGIELWRGEARIRFPLRDAALAAREKLVARGYEARVEWSYGRLEVGWEEAAFLRAQCMHLCLWRGLMAGWGGGWYFLLGLATLLHFHHPARWQGLRSLLLVLLMKVCPAELALPALAVLAAALAARRGRGWLHLLVYALVLSW